ncbi:NYN domain-containing protein [Pseudomonas chlororaphis]
MQWICSITKNIDPFALMTSDSDFTPLVLRLQESGFAASFRLIVDL